MIVKIIYYNNENIIYYVINNNKVFSILFWLINNNPILYSFFGYELQLPYWFKDSNQKIVNEMESKEEENISDLSSKEKVHI